MIKKCVKDFKKIASESRFFSFYNMLKEDCMDESNLMECSTSPLDASYLCKTYKIKLDCVKSSNKKYWGFRETIDSLCSYDGDVMFFISNGTNYYSIIFTSADTETLIGCLLIERNAN